LPKHEVAKRNKVIRRLSQKVSRTKVLFVSHRWLQLNHPDDQNNSKLRGIQRLLSNLELPEIEFIWMDYLCIPQEDLGAQLTAISSLPYYVRRCYDFVMVIGTDNPEATFETYLSRGWCRLERFAAASPMIDAEGKRLPIARSWTYDRNEDSLKQNLFSTAEDTEINPFFGVFRDGDADKRNIAPMLRGLCEHVEKYSGDDNMRQRAQHIKASVDALEKNSHEYLL